MEIVLPWQSVTKPLTELLDQALTASDLSAEKKKVFYAKHTVTGNSVKRSNTLLRLHFSVTPLIFHGTHGILRWLRLFGNF